MITLVIVTNPFSPQDGRTVSQVEYDGTLDELLKENAVDGVEMQATVNGYSVDNDYQIKNDDFVVIYPVVGKGGGKGGKGILGIIAAVALSVVSFGIASGGWLAGIGIKAGTFAAYAAATAVMFLGSSLIGRMAGQKIDTGGFDGENEPTYSWGGVQTMEGQNNAISLTYGKVKSGGQTIGKFVSAKDNEEYLNWLIAAGEGPLTITDIKLNDNAIENYSNVTCEIRTGTNDQEVIPYFNDTYFTKNLSYHMTTVDQWYTDTAQGTATEGLIFKIEFPNGLFHGTDGGNFAKNYVDIEMRYKLHSETEWHYYSDAAVRIEGESNKAIRKDFRVDNISAGSYDVGVRVIYQDYKDATRDQKECYFTGITSIVYDDFIYPCQALIGIRAKATDQLNGSPSLSFMKERQTVLVYNPHTTEYEQHLANNPAWACYDLLHQARELKNVNTDEMEIEVRGAAKELMRYDDFSEWAAWCDEKEYFVNIEINTVGELLEIANQKIAPIGHGLVVRFGTRYGCIYNHVQTPVQMFGMGNIKEGSFSEDFLKVSDRANCVEITFTNKDAGYEREVITIYGDTYDSDGYAKTAQMTFDGITDYKQAYREGMYQLYSNKYLLRTVTFTAGIDSIACTVGDVIMVSHDVPRWANSGRIESIDGATWVLPIELEDLTKSYRIQWRTQNDNLYTRACEVVSSADGWTTITVSGTLPEEDMPQAGDVFDIAVANIGSKPFVVKSITRSQDFERTISCLEYNENIYDENYDIPIIDYAQWYGEPGNVTGLVATLSQSKNEFGDNVGKLQCSWNMPDKGERFTVLLSTDGENWTIGKSNITGNTCELDVLPNTTYWVKVVTLLGVNQSSGTITGPIYPTGDGTLPVVTNLVGNTIYRGVKNGEVRYEIHLVWDAPLLANYRNCDVWYKTDNARTSDISMTQGVAISELGYQNKWQYAGQGYSDFTLSDVTTGDRYRFAVVTKDMLGNKNLIEASPMVTVTASARTETPNTPDGFGITYGNEIKVSWKEVANTDIAFYEVRDDVYCGNEDGHLLARTGGTLTTLTLTTRTGTLFLFAKSVLGKYSAPAKLIYAKDVPPQPAKPDVSANLGSINIVAEAIPNGCMGMRVYINGDGIVSAYTENNTYTHSCEAGIYDVSVAYVDIFGEGQRSTESRIVIKKTIDAKLLEDEAINIAKVDNAIKTALENANNSAVQLLEVDRSIRNINIDLNAVHELAEGTRMDIDTTNDRISTVISNLNNENGTTYASISSLNQTVDGISTRVTHVEEQADAADIAISDNEDAIAKANRDILAVQSDVQQTASSLTSTIQMLRGSASDQNQFEAISEIKQQANGLSVKVDNLIRATDEGDTTAMTQLKTDVQALAGDISTVTSKLQSEPNASGQYTAISRLNQNYNGLVTQIDSVRTTANGNTTNIDSLTTQMTARAGEITAITQKLNSEPDSKNQYTAITRLNQNYNGITATVTENKTIETNHYNANVNAINTNAAAIRTNTSSINQQADRITTVVTALGDYTDNSQQEFSAIAQLKDNIELKVSKDGVVSAINLTPETARIKGKLITLDGDTSVNGYFWANAVQAKSIDVSKINAEKLSALSANIGDVQGGTITGSTIIGSTIRNAGNTFSVDANGNIKGAKLTAGTIEASMITSAGFSVRASVIREGVINSGAKIPLPSGYTETQCLWTAYVVENSAERDIYPAGSYTPNNLVVHEDRTVNVWYAGTYTRHEGGDSYEQSFVVSGKARYRIIGIK